MVHIDTSIKDSPGQPCNAFRRERSVGRRISGIHAPPTGQANPRERGHGAAGARAPLHRAARIQAGTHRSIRRRSACSFGSSQANQTSNSFSVPSKKYSSSSAPPFIVGTSCSEFPSSFITTRSSLKMGYQGAVLGGRWV